MTAEALTVQDRLEIIDLIVGYSHAIDKGDVEAYVGCFVPDGILEGAGGHTIGHDEIRKRGYLQVQAGRVGGTPARLRHFVSMPLIAGDGERATASTNCVYLSYDDEKRIAVPMISCYEDTIVKVDGRWLFERRNIRAMLGVPNPMPEILAIRQP
jgi:hypothetical protein